MDASLPDPDPQQFESWCSARGIYRPKVRHGSVGCDSAAGQGLFVRAGCTIVRGEEFVSVPVDAMITEAVSRSSEVGRAIADENAARERQRAESAGGASRPHRISARTLFYCFLIHARHSLSSPFRPWLVHGVPRSYDLPLTWSDDEVALLRGTNLGEAVPHRLRQLRSKYAHAFPALTQRDPDLFPAAVFSWDNFLWAHCTYSSRGFPAQLADPALAPSSSSSLPGAVSASLKSGPTISLGSGSGSDNGSAATQSGSAPPSRSPLGCLIPYLDLTNHRFMQPITWLHTPLSSNANAAAAAAGTDESAAAMHPHDRALREEAAQAAKAGSAVIEPVPLQARVSLCAGEDILSGAEIFNNYGAKANEELLMGYGFTLPSNSADEVTLALGARAVSNDKLALLHAAGSGSGPALKLHQYLRRQGGPPATLLQVLRACAMDEAAMQGCSTHWLPVAAPELLPTPAAVESVASSAAALQQVLSTPCHRLEVSMLLTLRSLLLGRLKRLQLWDPESHAAVPLERGLVESDTGLLQLRTLQADYFRCFDVADEAARKLNGQNGVGNYHVECALNYRLGQRDVLVSCVAHVDALVARAAADAMSALQQSDLLAYAPAVTLPTAPSGADASGATAAPRKKRKTGRSTQVGVEGNASAPASWNDMLAAYNSWLVNIGGQANADWSGGRWTLESACDVPDASTPATASSSGSASADFVSTPLLLALPVSSLISMETIGATPSFEPCVELVEGLQEEQVAVLFLLHERAKGSESQWAAWLALAAAVAPVAAPTATDDDEDMASQLSSREAALFDLHGQLFPALSDAHPDLFSPLLHSWSHFLWAARLVHDHRVSFVAPGVPGVRVGAVLPVPCMPLPAPFPLSVVEALARQQQGDAGADADADAAQDGSGEVLVFRSLVSLQRGALPTLCTPTATHAWPDLLDYSVPLLSRTAAASTATPATSSTLDSIPSTSLPLPSVSLPCASLLDFHAQVLEAQSASGSAPFGLALRPMSPAHRALWTKLHVDEATNFVLTDALPVTPLLLAVVRSLFLSASQLAVASGASAASLSASASSSSLPVPSPSPSSSAPLTGALVDDSDEEEDDADTNGRERDTGDDQGGGDEEADEEQEEAEAEEGEDASAPVDQTLLQQAVRRFMQALRHNQMQQLGEEETEREEEGGVAAAAAATAAPTAFPSVVTVPPQQLRRFWRQEQQRILAAPMQA